MKFERLQCLLTKGQYTDKCYPNIPAPVYDYAVRKVLDLKKTNRKSCPTIADILYQLIIFGLDEVDNHDFKPFKKTDETFSIRIKTGHPVNKRMKEIQPDGISLTSLAVNLMEIAIKNEKKWQT